MGPSAERDQGHEAESGSTPAGVRGKGRRGIATRLRAPEQELDKRVGELRNPSSAVASRNIGRSSFGPSKHLAAGACNPKSKRHPERKRATLRICGWAVSRTPHKFCFGNWGRASTTRESRSVQQAHNPTGRRREGVPACCQWRISVSSCMLCFDVCIYCISCKDHAPDARAGVRDELAVREIAGQEATKHVAGALSSVYPCV